MEALLPYPPSVNHYWGTSGRRRYVGKEGVLFRCRVLAAGRPPAPLRGRLSVGVVLYPPDRRKSDIDNRMKGLLDALAHAGWYLDDSQIDELHVLRGEVRAGGAALVKVEPFGGRGCD